MMHEKEDVIYVNRNSYFHKVVSSIVLVSFLSMTIGQSYAMTNGLETEEQSRIKPFSKVAPAPEGFDLENQGVVEMEHLVHPSSSKVTPEDHSYLEEPKSLNFLQRLLADFTSKVTPQSQGWEKVENEKVLTGSPVITRGANIDGEEDEEKGASKQPSGIAGNLETDDPCEDEKVKAFFAEVMRSDVSKEDLRKAIGAAILTVALGYVIRSEVNWWINSFVNQFITTDVGYRFIYMNPYGNHFINDVINWQLGNLAVTLTPYIYKRSQKLLNLLPIRYLNGDPTSSDIRTKFGRVPEGVGIAAAVLCAGATSVSAAMQLYADTVIASAFIATTCAPFLATFLFIDTFLRYNDLKDSIYAYLFINMAATWAKVAGWRAKTDEEKAAAKAKEEKANQDALNREFLDKALGEGINKLGKMKDEGVIKREEELETLKKQPIKAVRKLLGKKVKDSAQLTQQESRTASNKLGLGAQELAQLSQHHEEVQQEESSRKLKQRISLGLGEVLAGLGMYFTFQGTLGAAETGIQASVPGKLGDVAIASNHDINMARYRVWREDTASIRSEPLTEVGGSYVNATYINGTYVNGTGTYVGGTFVNVDALNSWWTKCVNSAERYQYVNNSVGSSGFSFGYECPGVSFTLNSWTANRGDLDSDMGLAWYPYIDGSNAGFAGIKGINTNDDELIKTPDIKLSADKEWAAYLMSGVRSAASGALTLKSVGQVINTDDTLLSPSTKILTSSLYETLTTNPGDMFTYFSLGALGLVAAAVLGRLFFLTLTSVESLIYASPTAMSAWISESGMKDQRLMWTQVGATGLSAAINVFPDFKESYATLPHDLEKVVLYSGAMKQKRAAFLRAEFIDVLKAMREAGKTATPEAVQTMMDVLGLSKSGLKRRTAAIHA